MFLLLLKHTWIALIVACTTSLLLTPLIIKLARHKNWVVAPRADRWHKVPTALMGGIGIFAAYLITVLLNFKFANWLIFGGSVLMFLIGLVDDFKEVKPVVKLIGQMGGSLILVFHGYIFGGGLLGWAGIPLTFIWVIGITNAINLLDNMDGLSAGIVCIISAIAGILNLMIGQLPVAYMAFTIAGASLGFLFYNFNPAKIFMGDCGSLFLGYLVSFFGVSVQQSSGSSSAILMLLVPISLMAIPIMDTSLVTIKRLLAGRRIDQGGKDHTSHRLVALGLSEKKAVLSLYFVSALWGGLCILILKTSINSLLLCVVLLTVSSLIFAVLLSQVKVYDETEEKLIYLRSRGEKEGNNLFFRFFLFHKKLIVGVIIDILIIYSSFFIAAVCTKVVPNNSYFILALFISIKISLFYISNLYYMMWRYMAIMESVGYFLSLLISSTILIAVIYWRNKIGIYSFSFFLVDFLITFTGIIFSRLLYRLLKELFNQNKKFSQKVIIYGAGDSGYLLIKELLQNKKYGLKPIGWIDDDNAKHNMQLSGLKIHGHSKNVVEICKKYNANAILISTNSITVEKENELRKILAAEKILVGRFNLNVHFE